MMNHKMSVFGVCAVLAAAGVLLVGCGGEEEEVVVREAAPPPPPPPPPPPSLDELMEQLRIDERVMMFDEYAPDSESERVAILEFFDAFARGNHEELRRKMSSQDAGELDVLVEEGLWRNTVEGIEMIEIQSGRSPHGDKCVLAMYVIDGQDQVQLWYYRDDGNRFQFESAPMPPDLIRELSGDWIKAWHEILEEQVEIASRPDEEIEMPQRNLDQGEGAGGTGDSPGTQPQSPGRPGDSPRSPGR